MRTVSDDAINMGSYGLGAIAISVGTTLIVQEQTRMSSPGWQVALSVPGVGSDLWGLYIALAGLVMLGGLLARRRFLVGIGGIAVSFALLARTVASLLALSEPNASGTAPQFYFLITALYFAHGVTLLRRT